MKKPILLLLVLTVLLFPMCVSATSVPVLEDGQYTIEVTLYGGSGRAAVNSPAELKVKDGKATATLIWSSSSYEYMRLDDVTYKPVQTDGNSTFEIPVLFDTDMPLVAQTIAMSEPHEIEYSLRFDSSTLKSQKSQNNTGVLIVSICAVFLFFVLLGFWLAKRNQKQKQGGSSNR